MKIAWHARRGALTGLLKRHFGAVFCDFWGLLRTFSSLDSLLDAHESVVTHRVDNVEDALVNHILLVLWPSSLQFRLIYYLVVQPHVRILHCVHNFIRTILLSDFFCLLLAILFNHDLLLDLAICQPVTMKIKSWLHLSCRLFYSEIVLVLLEIVLDMFFFCWTRSAW